jgi:hypothetical protein
MAEEITENPTLETPVETEPVVEAPTTESLDSFQSTLEEFGVTDNKDLTGRLNASQQTGQLGNLLGEERRVNQELREQNERLVKGARPRNEPDLDGYGEGQTVDMESLITKVYRQERGREQKQATAFQQRQVQQYGKIVNNKNYKGEIKKLWDDKTQDPQYLYQIQNGMIDPVEAFHTLVDDYKTNLIVEAGKTIGTLRGGPKPEIPHVEGSERIPQNIVSSDPAQDKTLASKVLKELREKVEKGGVLTSYEEEIVADTVWKDTPLA